MTFRALNNRVYWNTTPLEWKDCHSLLGVFLGDGYAPLYWPLHDAMTEAGMIPARPPIPTPDLTYAAPPEKAWVADDRRQA